MPYYVYRYMHPDYPWLYVGKTVNLKNRIYQHDFCSSDNIDRSKSELLQDSTVLYIELANATQMNYIEKILIDKYKPELNIADNHPEECPIDFTFPKWKKFLRRYETQSFDYNMRVNTPTLTEERENVIDIKRYRIGGLGVTLLVGYCPRNGKTYKIYYDGGTQYTKDRVVHMTYIRGDFTSWDGEHIGMKDDEWWDYQTFMWLLFSNDADEEYPNNIDWKAAFPKDTIWREMCKNEMYTEG